MSASPALGSVRGMGYLDVFHSLTTDEKANGSTFTAGTPAAASRTGRAGRAGSA